MSVAVSVKGVHKAFGGVAALRGVSFDVEAGSIVGLIGPNGAGKSTLLNVMSNVTLPGAGTVAIGGKDIGGLPRHRLAALGVVRTFQSARTFPHLSVIDNVIVGAYLTKPVGHAASEVLGWHTSGRRQILTERAKALLQAFGLLQWSESNPRELPAALTKYLDLARAIMARPRLLLLDEPAAGLSNIETREMGDAIRGINDSGTTIIVVEHDMSLVFTVADSVVVLDAGEIIAAGEPAAIRTEAAVIKAYLGAGLDDA